MIFRSYSKLNLSLRVLSKRKSGLHNIQSNVVKINLFDKIKMKKLKGHADVINFVGKFKKEVNKKNNTVIKTLNFLRKKNLINNYYKITITKNIPVYSGLGGGTGNAFFIIKKLIKRNLSLNQKKFFQEKIGSDLRLFESKFLFQNSLYSVLKCRLKLKLFFLLVFPHGMRCSTRLIYSKVKKFSSPYKINFSKIRNNETYLNLISNDRNDLQDIVEREHPKIKKILSDLSNLKLSQFSRVTGSGSICFAVFKTENAAKKGLIKIKKKYPKFWSVVTKPI